MNGFNEQVDGARDLGIQTRTAQEMRTGPEKAGFLEISEKQCSWNTSETEEGARILSFVKSKVQSSNKILHEGGRERVRPQMMLSMVLWGLKEKDCQISVNGHYIIAQKPNLMEPLQQKTEPKSRLLFEMKSRFFKQTRTVARGGPTRPRKPKSCP